MSNIQNNGHRQPRRPFYTNLSIEQRAAVAARWVDEGWPATKAAGLACVNPTYVWLAHRLNEDERSKLVSGELKLAWLHKEHCQYLAERRAQQVAAEREVQAQVEREEQVRAVDAVLGTVSFDRVVERIVANFGPEPLLEELDILLQRNGRDLSQLILRVCDRERVMRVFDAVTAPQAMAAE
jgi:hypothetical protein